VSKKAKKWNKKKETCKFHLPKMKLQNKKQKTKKRNYY